MVKAEYFCDRCGGRALSRYGLKSVTVERFGCNPTKMDVCEKCSTEIARFVESAMAIDAVGQRSENPI